MRTHVRQQGMGYLIAVLATLVVAAGRFALVDELGDVAATIPFVLPVIVAAWYGGRSAGLLATALCLAACAYLFVPPHYSMVVDSTAEAVALSLFAVVGVTVSLLCGALHAARRRLEWKRARLEAEVAERAKAEAAAGARAERLRATLDSITDAFVTMDREWRLTHVNAAAERLLGAKREDLVGRDNWELYPETKGTIVEESYRRAMEQQTAVEFESYYEPWGRWYEGKVYPTPDGLAVAFHEITERKRAQERAREGEALYRALAANLPNGAAFVVGPDLRYRLAEGQALRAAGLSPADFEGKTLAEALPPELAARYEPHYRTALAGEHFRWEHEAHGRHYVSHGVPLRAADGTVYAALAVSYDITERKEAERAVRAAEGQLRLITDAVPALISYVGPDRRYRLVNRAYETWFNTSRERVVGRHMRDVLGDQAWAVIGPRIDRAFAGEACDFEVEAPYRAGGVRWIHAAYAPDKDEAGRVRGVVVLVTDVTARKQAEDRLRENTAREHAFLEHLPVGIWFLNAEGRITYGNRAGQQIWAGARYVGADEFHEYKGWWHGTDRLLAADDWGAARAVRRGETCLDELIDIECFDGTRKTMLNSAVPVRDADGAVLGAVVINQDVTGRIRAEQALRASEERAALVRRWSGVGVWYCDEPTQQLVWDEITKGHFFLPPDAEVSVPVFYERLHPDDRVAVLAAVQECRVGDKLFDREYRALDPATGAVRWVRSVGRATQAADGTPLRFDGVTLDITAHKRAEEALRDAARRKDEFLATLAHELRNPLAPVRNAVQILKAKGPPDQDSAWARDVIDRQVAQMARLLDDLLDVSRITRGKLELRRQRVELGGVVETAVETSRPLIEAGGHELTVDLPPGPVHLDADPVRLAQVLSNLLNNAAKYTERGGRIHLAAERNGASVLVSVKDTGIGVEGEMLPRLFEMFSQAKPALERAQGGLGIGLALVRGLVEMHGGCVTARSDGPGTGSEFAVHLPLAESPPRQELPAPSAADVPRPPACRILVADDNRDAADSLAMMLELMGNAVRTANDGQEAVEVAAEFRPDVALLDIGMPRMNGYEAARRMRAEPWGRGLVIVALTGWGQEEDRRRSREAGFDVHLVKPVDPAAIEKVLLERTATAAG